MSSILWEKTIQCKYPLENILARSSHKSTHSKSLFQHPLHKLSLSVPFYVCQDGKLDFTWLCVFPASLRLVFINMSAKIQLFFTWTFLNQLRMPATKKYKICLIPVCIFRNQVLSPYKVNWPLFVDCYIICM